MTLTTATREPVALGDGTTARSRAAARWRRSRTAVLAGAVVLAVMVVVVLLPQRQQDALTYSTGNPGQHGARAVAQILRAQGVDVRQVTDVDAAVAAVPGSGSDTTLAVLGDAWLNPDDAQRLTATGADLVLVDLDYTLDSFVPGLEPAGSSSTAQTFRAGCTDPDASAAGTITGYRQLDVSQMSGATTCFGSDGLAAYVVIGGSRTIRVLADATPLLNGSLTAQGNAALALRALGHHRTLVWLVPTEPTLTTSKVSTWDLMPPVVQSLALLGAALLGVLALWRGRRLGRVVAEPLPVVVPSGEATRGRGRLYRAHQSTARAAAALRAGTALRLGARLGVPRSATGPTLAAAVAAATGRPVEEIGALIYGPPPTGGAALLELAADLHRLESEGHRP